MVRKILIILIKVYIIYSFIKTILLRKKRGEIQVLLTSYPPRFKQLAWTLVSLYVNTDGKINIVFFENDKIKINKKLNWIIKTVGAKIWYTPLDYKSYKKIYPIIQKKITGNILICDDDIFYSKNWYKEINKIYHQNIAVGSAAHEVKYNDNGKIEKYNKWTKRVEKQSGDKIFLTGAGGILFNTNRINKDIFFNYDFINVCPNNDDLWINLNMLSDTDKYATKKTRLINWEINDINSLYIKNSEGRLDSELEQYLKYKRHV